MNNNQTSQTGITLIELLVGLLLGSILLFIVAGILVQALQFRERSLVMSDLHKTLVDVVRDITDESRWASGITIGQNPDIIKIYHGEEIEINYVLDSPQEHLVKKTIVNGVTSQTNLNPGHIQITGWSVALMPWDSALPPEQNKPTAIVLSLKLTSRRFPQISLSAFNPIALRISTIFIQGN
jgi:Tfp pilus assembly protein PilE